MQLTMGICILLTGTLYAVLLQIAPVNIPSQSEMQLVHEMGPESVLDRADTLIVMPVKMDAVILDAIALELPSFRGRAISTGEAEGNVMDGYTLILPAPT